VSPVIVIFVLIAFLKKAADTAGVIGWFFTLAVAIFYFKTSPRVCLVASVAGVVESLPITLMVVASLFQMGVMLECGAVDLSDAGYYLQGSYKHPLPRPWLQIVEPAARWERYDAARNIPDDAADAVTGGGTCTSTRATTASS
jgi:hypothetical protein